MKRGIQTMDKTFTTSNGNTYYFIAKDYSKLTSKERDIIHTVNNNVYSFRDLYKCYNNPSIDKRDAYQRCYTDLKDIIIILCDKYGGNAKDYIVDDYGIINYNTFMFIFGACIHNIVNNDEIFIYCTAKNYYCIKIIEL